MLFDFAAYLFNIKNNNHYINDYLNCYSTFILNSKTDASSLLKSRMNLIVDYYYNSNSTSNKTNSKNIYISYYLSNFKDEFLNKPLLTYPHIENKNEDEIDDGYYDDDMRSHYKSIATIPQPKPEEDFTEIDEYYRNLEYEEELNKNNKNMNENDYDEYDEYDYDYDEYEYDYGNNDIEYENNDDYEYY